MLDKIDMKKIFFRFSELLFNVAAYVDDDK